MFSILLHNIPLHDTLLLMRNGSGLLLANATCQFVKSGWHFDHPNFARV